MTIAQIKSPDDGTEDLVELARALSPEKRRALAAELASRTDAPHGLISFLARDEIVIAEPVILQSPVLIEEDFAAIAKFGSPAHVARLRRRPELSQKIRDQIDAHCHAENALLEVLRAGNLDAFRSMLSELAGNGTEPALESLENDDGRALACICKDAGLSRAAYSAIVLLSNPARASEKTEALLYASETDWEETTRAA
jgi:uncharacterized protein (DUF2336 family)